MFQRVFNDSENTFRAAGSFVKQVSVRETGASVCESNEGVILTQERYKPLDSERLPLPVLSFKSHYSQLKSQIGSF